MWPWGPSWPRVNPRTMFSSPEDVPWSFSGVGPSSSCTFWKPLPSLCLYTCAFCRISYTWGEAVGGLWVWTLSSSRCFPDLSVQSHVSIVCSFLLPSAFPLYGSFVICFSIQVLVGSYGKNHSALWGVVYVSWPHPFCTNTYKCENCQTIVFQDGPSFVRTCWQRVSSRCPHLCWRPVLLVAHGVEFKPLSYVCISLWFYLHFPRDFLFILPLYRTVFSHLLPILYWVSLSFNYETYICVYIYIHI